MFATLVAVVLVLCCAPPLVLGTQIRCDDARLKCALRTGCGMALQEYILHCSTVLSKVPAYCPEKCQHALISLTSTDEGKDLMMCTCEDDMCRETKQRVEVCRPHVMRATRNESIVSCTVAELICSADGVCSTALDYYNRYCRPMFQGRKCSHRCKNSIGILLRQEKAAKLANCVCDGRESYNCEEIRTNMAWLCFNKAPAVQPPLDPPPDVTLEGAGSAHNLLPTSLGLLLLLSCWLST